MKKFLPTGLILLLMACTGDPFETAIKALNENDFDRAQKFLLKVEEQNERYDSAQALLVKLPDAAVEYWLAEAEINMLNGEFDAALDACDKALHFRFENKDAIQMNDEVKKAAAEYWIERAKKRLEEDELAKAIKAVEEALEYRPEDRAAHRMKEKILKTQEKKDEQKAIAKRTEYAKEYEEKMLDKEINVTVTTRGTKTTTLRINYPAATNVQAHEMKKDKPFLGKLRKLGFEKVILIGLNNERWVWELDKI